MLTFLSYKLNQYLQNNEYAGERFAILLDQYIHSASDRMFKQLSPETGQATSNYEESNLCLHHPSYWLSCIIDCFHTGKHLRSHQKMPSRGFSFYSMTTSIRLDITVGQTVVVFSGKAETRHTI